VVKLSIVVDHKYSHCLHLGAYYNDISFGDSL
jgi:hypothetical protein